MLIVTNEEGTSCEPRLTKYSIRDFTGQISSWVAPSVMLVPLLKESVLDFLILTSVIEGLSQSSTAMSLYE